MSIFPITCQILIIEQFKSRTYQNKMERSRLPLLHRLLAVLGDIVLDLLLLHERGKDGLIDGVICNAGE